jgi:acyl carrier protein
MTPMTSQHLEKLQSIFRLVFQLPADADVSTVRQGVEPRWDSLAHVMLIAALENEFDIHIDTADAMHLTSFAVAEQLVGRKLA